MSLKPPGWYQDSADRRGHRYWDGKAWMSPPPEGDEVSSEESDGPPVPSAVPG